MRNTFYFLTTLILGLFCFNSVLANAQAPEPLFSDAVSSNQLRADIELPPTVKKERGVVINGSLLDATSASAFAKPGAGNTILLNLFADATYYAVLTNSTNSSDGKTTIWTGSLEGQTRSSVAIASTGGVTVGNIRTDDGRWFKIRFKGAGVHAVQELNEADMPPLLEPLVPNIPAGSAIPAAGVAGDSGAIINVMVVYTPAARIGLGGTAGIITEINLAVTMANAAFTASGVGTQFNLAHTAEVAYTEYIGGATACGGDPCSNSFDTSLYDLTLTADGIIDNVHALRDQYKADVVQMIISDHTSGGLGWVMQPGHIGNTGFATAAFSIVDWYGVAGWAFDHEIGHNMGSAHNRSIASVTGAYTYSYGYLSPTSQWHTIMAYGSSCGYCPRTEHWSNPAINHPTSGQALGITVSLPNEADNSTSLNNTKLTAANWRVGVPPTPASLTSHVNGDTFTSGTETFQWGAATGAQQYNIFVGTSIGASNISALNASTNLTATISGLPTDGSQVYVRLFTKLSGVFYFNDYQFTAYTAPAPTPASLTSHVNGDTFTSGTETFQWGAATGAQQYNIFVGTSIGASNISALNASTNLTATISGLPTDGSQVYVRLFTKLSGVFYFNDYQFTAYTAPAPTPASLTSHVNGDTFTSGTETFQWGAATGAQQYNIFVGTSIGASNISALNASTNLTATISGLPTDGSQVYVRLFTKLSGVFYFNDYQFTAYTAPAPTPASLTSHVNGDTFTSGTETFQWGAATGAQQYNIFVGTSIGASNISALNASTNLTATISGLPTDGSQVYVRLFTKLSGVFYFNDYQFTAYTAPAPTPASLTSHVNGDTFTSGTETFQWGAATGADRYLVWAGTSVGASDIGALGTATTTLTLTGLPIDGSLVYVRLYTRISGIWYFNDYLFSAHSSGAALTSHANLATFTSGTEAFTWNAVTGADRYLVWAGTSAGSNDLGALGTVTTSLTFTGLPTDGSEVYIRLYSRISGVWCYRDYLFTAKTITTP